MVNPNTRPKSIVDKNGKQTTVHVSNDTSSVGSDRVRLVPPTSAAKGESRPYEDWTPVQVDSELARIYSERGALRGQIGRLEYDTEWRTKEIDKDKARGRFDPEGYYTKQHLDKIESNGKAIEALEEQVVEKYEEAAPLEDEFVASGGWERYYQVTNSNGHVHKTMNCSTCFPTTEFYWHVDKSGTSNDDLVEQAGSDACTVCFPNAPVETLNRPGSLETPDGKEARERREEAAAKKAAKQISDAEKAIMMPDGSPVKDTFGWKMKTERTARTAAVDSLVSIHIYDRDEGYGGDPNDPDSMTYRHGRVLRDVVAAVSAKHGTPESEIMEEFEKKARAKVKKEYPSEYLDRWDGNLADSKAK